MLSAKAHRLLGGIRFELVIMELMYMDWDGGSVRGLWSMGSIDLGTLIMPRKKVCRVGHSRSRSNRNKNRLQYHKSKNLGPSRSRRSDRSHKIYASLFFIPMRNNNNNNKQTIIQRELFHDISTISSIPSPRVWGRFICRNIRFICRSINAFFYLWENYHGLLLCMIYMTIMDLFTFFSF
jgi:hypothetical protein